MPENRLGIKRSAFGVTVMRIVFVAVVAGLEG
jgi:hypothetical protein